MRPIYNLAAAPRQFAALYAYARGITLGEAITDLIRKSQRAATVDPEPIMFALGPSGFPIFPPKGRILTTEMVLTAQEEDFD